MITIALDAMGGDFAPRAPVEAALRAAGESLCRVLLVGDEEKLAAELAGKAPDASRTGSAIGAGIEIHHTPDRILMDESPAEALRKKPRASVRVAFDLARDGEAQAVVSAGNSGASMVAGKRALNTLQGIGRPAIATHLPHPRGQSVLLDSGANVDCKPGYLLQFAEMGAIYARIVLEAGQPKVGLLNIGNEAAKGNDLTRQAHQLLAGSSLHFEGNLEPKDLFRGRADVVVCDGFAGNLVLKTAEAAGANLRMLLRETIPGSLMARLGHRLMRGFFLDLARRTDYREVGGSLLLGLNGVGIVCHGASNPRTIYNGIRLAVQCVERRLVEEIGQGINGLSSQKSAPA